LVLKSEYFSKNCSSSNPAKNQSNTYFLEHSTDTTAMKSFDDATSMTLCIALLATILAWWFGKKSFQLTQQAFEQSIEQIKASIVASSLNTTTTLQANQELINHQLQIQTNEFNFQKEQEAKKNLIDLSTSFIQTGKKIFSILSKYTDQLSQSDWRKFVNYSCLYTPSSFKNNQEFLDSYLSVNKEVENMAQLLFKFSVLTKPDNPKVSTALQHLTQATDLAIEQRNMYQYTDKNQHKIQLDNLNTAVQNARVALIEVIQDKNCFL